MAYVEEMVAIVSVLLLFLAHPAVSSYCGPIEHDIRNLTKRSFWYFEHSESVGTCELFKPGEIKDVTSTCLFYFSICKPVPRYCPDESGICLANSVIFPAEHNGTSPRQLYSEFIKIGTYSEDFPKSEANFFTLHFGSSEENPPDGKAYQTLLIFQCDHNAAWNSSGDGKVLPATKLDLDSSKVPPQYTVTFNYSGACKYGGGGGGGNEGPTTGLSVGSILLVVFFPGVFLYCVVGALINRGSGKTGKDLVPNSKFWSNLPGLIADGFSFALAKITCSEMTTTRQTYNQM